MAITTYNLRIQLNCGTLPHLNQLFLMAILLPEDASDNKGMFYAYLKAIQSFLITTGSLPINIKVCIEGEGNWIQWINAVFK